MFLSCRDIDYIISENIRAMESAMVSS